MASVNVHDVQGDGAQRQHAREDALNELRSLVAALERVQDEARERDKWTPLSQLVAGWVVLWTTPLACALTVLAAIVWSPAVAFVLAGVETAGALFLRTRHLSHPWWRRWIYGIAIAVVLIAIA